MITDKPIPLTQHPCARMRENGLTEDRVKMLWKESVEVALPVKKMMQKFFYHNINYIRSAKYFSAKGYLFTVGTRDPQNPVIVTITKQDK